MKKSSVKEMRRPELWIRAGLLLFIPLVLVGCGREEIRVYNIPKEIAAADQPHVHWDLPAGWEERAATGMRAASFVVSGTGDELADVSVIPLPGGAGSELANVNRWRAEVGLEPIEEGQLASVTEQVSVAGTDGKLVDLVGENPATKKPERILAATAVTGETTWFIKMRGPAELVSGQKAAFKGFLSSLTFHDADAHAPGHTAERAVERPMPAPASAPAGSPALPEWTLPSGWQQLSDAPMVLARFSVGGDAAGKGEVAISAFPGDVGGLLANVNRWRGQIGLAPITEGELQNVTTPVDVDGEKAILVDMTNPASAAAANRVVVVVAPRDGRTWFFKFTGTDAVVEQQKEAFIQFVQSVRFPHA